MRKRLRKFTWPLAYSLGPKFLAGIKFLVLTRMLGPKEFGAYAFALIWIAVTEGVSEFGFRQAIVQQKSDPKIQEIGAMNTMLLLRGLAVAPLMLGAAFFFHSYTTAVDVFTIALICMTPCFRSLYAVSIGIALRRLDYRRLFYFEGTWRSFDLLITFLAVFYFHRSSRTAVATTAMAELSALMISIWILGNQFVFSRNLACARSVVQYGKWIWGQSLVIVLMNQFDKVFVAGKFGAQSMGGYQGINRMLQLVIADPVIMFTNVWFPKVAMDLRQNPDLARRGFLDLFHVLSLVLSVVILGLIIGKDHLVVLVFGVPWLPYANLVPIFGSTMAVGAIVGVLTTWHRAAGTPRMVTFATSCQFIVYVIGIFWLGARWGSPGVARAVNLSLLVIAPILLFTLGHGMGPALARRIGAPILWFLALSSSLPGRVAYLSSLALGTMAIVFLLREAMRIRVAGTFRNAPARML